jgi:hypothetical protein
LVWRRVPHPDFSDQGDWMYETHYRGLRLAACYNEGGPAAFIGHPADERWLDSIACDGSFESGADRCIEFADEALTRTDMLECLGVRSVAIAA